MDNTSQSPSSAAAQRLCAQCGKPLDPGAAFCGSCGASAQAGSSIGGAAASAPAAPPAAKQDWRKYAGALAIGCAMLWKYKLALYIALRSISLFGR